MGRELLQILGGLRTENLPFAYRCRADDPAVDFIRSVGGRVYQEVPGLRLDLTETSCRMAKSQGVRVCINTDAHGTTDLDHMVYGVGQARRGWLGKKDVLNTLPLKSLRAALAKTMGK